MVENSPKQAIIEELCAHHEGLEAQEETFHFFQFRLLPDRQIHEVTFENKAGQLQRWICFVLQEPEEGTWHMVGGANITGTNCLPPGDNPIVRLSGSNLADFWVGGYVLVARERDVVSARLVSSNGVVLEDKIQDGLVMFITEQKVLTPIKVELYNSKKNLVGTQPWPYIPSWFRSHSPELHSLFPNE